MDRIPSFSKNHDLLQPGLHKSMEMQGVTTWDLRFKKPNAGDFITPKALHSIEHMLATTLRNSSLKENVIYFGPMGCRTGFYLLTVNMNYGEVKELIIEGIAEALKFDSVPGSEKVECGNYLEHDLDGAKIELTEYLRLLERL